MEVLGIDVGGTNIKGAIVDLDSGELLTKRIKYPTPQPATPESFKSILRQIKEDLSYSGEKVGVGFPAIINNSICNSATNIDDGWIGLHLHEYFSEVFNCKASVVNDADAAGLAELYFGKLINNKGTSILLTIGTGIGSALFIDEHLVPNTELGHLKFKGGIAEQFISNKIRKEQNLSLEAFAIKLNELLLHIEFLFSPTKFLLGGGLSKDFKDFKIHFDPKFNIDSAKYYNKSGLIGAALATKV